MTLFLDNLQELLQPSPSHLELCSLTVIGVIALNSLSILTIYGHFMYACLSLIQPIRFTHMCILVHAHPAYKGASPTHFPQILSFTGLLNVALCQSGSHPQLFISSPQSFGWGNYSVSFHLILSLSLVLLFINCLSYCLVYLFETSLLGSTRLDTCLRSAQTRLTTWFNWAGVQLCRVVITFWSFEPDSD